MHKFIIFFTCFDKRFSFIVVTLFCGSSISLFALRKIDGEDIGIEYFSFHLATFTANKYCFNVFFFHIKFHKMIKRMFRKNNDAIGC